MTQEDKQLLLVDLCARLPYGVKTQCISNTIVCIGPYTLDTIVLDRFFNENTEYVPFDEVKPYLFPLSSMTEEQREELFIVVLDECVAVSKYSFTDMTGYSEIPMRYVLDAIDWLNKNHFDFRNLIGRGLAIDCTNLNIY